VLGRNLFGPAAGKGPALWVGDMDQPLGPMYIDDFAHGLADLGEHDAALGKAWHLPTPSPTTARAFLNLLSAQAQRPIKVLRLGPTTTRILGVGWPVLREGAEMLYQFRQPHSVDATAYRTVIGTGRVTSYADGIDATLRWYATTASRPLTAVGR
jgi:nucleoside-diphosphate-sugar epimerase